MEAPFSLDTGMAGVDDGQGGFSGKVNCSQFRRAVPYYKLYAAFFESLFAGDTSVCHDDHSRAVIMLANQLAIVTGLDAVRVKRLLYQTGLVTEKWEEKRGNSTWIEYQIHDAIRYVSGAKR